MNEEWRHVIGFEGLYEVSNTGKIRSLDRTITYSRGQGFFEKRVRGVLLKPGLTSVGYPSVVLGRKHGTALVHRVVAEAFIGPRPEGHEVRHKDGTRDNNCAENLEYGTRRDNVPDARRHGTLYAGHDRQRKVPHSDHDKIRKMYAEGRGQEELANAWGVSGAVIHRILRCGLC